MIIGGGTAKEIKFICLDCKKKIAVDTLYMGLVIYAVMPYPWLSVLVGLANKLKRPIKANIICNECIKGSKHKEELNLLNEVCYAYNSIIKKEKDLYSHRLINFEQYVSDYGKKEFENIFSKSSLEQFLKANANSSEKLKRKTQNFLSQKVKSIITDYLSKEQNPSKLFSEEDQFKKLVEKNKLFPMKKYSAGIATTTKKLVKFDFDNTCQDIEFYLIFGKEQSDFMNDYIKQIGPRGIDIESNDLSMENGMLKIFAKRFISLYGED